MTRLVVLGAGGHGIVAGDAASSSEKWQEVCFLDDVEKELAGYTVIGKFDEWQQHMRDDTSFLVAVGDNAAREGLVGAISECGAPIATVMHAGAIVSSLADIAPGTLVCAGAVINPRAKVGRGAIVNTGATVDHDCSLGDFVHISPGAHLAGSAIVGARSWVGIGAVVRDGVVIGNDCVIGAGAAVTSDVPSGETVVGVPARPVSGA